MEQKLIIAEILKHKPQGIKLYSPIFGDCTFCYVKDESSDICVRRPYNEVNYFNFDGVYHTGGECLLFPSNEMRDWSKFAWQNGDVLISNDGGTEVIFDNGTMILIQVFIVSITLTVKIRIKSYITKNSYAQLKDIPLKIRILLRPTLTP